MFASKNSFSSSRSSYFRTKLKAKEQNSEKKVIDVEGYKKPIKLVVPLPQLLKGYSIMVSTKEVILCAMFEFAVRVVDSVSCLGWFTFTFLNYCNSH